MKLVKRLLESPDIIRIADMVLEYDHVKATTFCFIDDQHIAIGDRTHIFIYNALRKFRKSGNYSVFKDYGVKFLPKRPSKESLLEAADGLVGDMGGNRMKTFAGRIWVGLTSKAIGKFSAVSFWTTSKASGAKRKLGSAIHIFGVGDEPLYVEFIDSKQPEVINLGSDSGSLISKSNPNLTPEQIADILRRAHIDKQSLSREERDVVDEFRPKVTKRLFDEPMVSIRSKVSTSESEHT
jgi:hypothetical protein